MSETTDQAATSSDEQPVESPKQFGNDGLNGSMMRELQEQIEARIKPLLEPPQPERDPRLDDLSAEETDLLTETQRTYQERLDELELRNQLLEMSRERPREAAIIERLLQAETLADMAEAIGAAFGEQEPEQQVAEVDRNNPPTSPLTYGSIADMIRLPDGQMITREAGLEILRSAQTLNG